MLRKLYKHSAGLSASVDAGRSISTAIRALSTAPAMQLVIKAHEGESKVKTITLDVCSSDTVESVKSKLQETEGKICLFL